MDETFDISRTTRYWADGAAYDLATGRSLLEAKRFPYALFFGHPSLEKTLKALVVKATWAHAPHAHSLTLLASKTNVKMPEAIFDRLAEYTEFHLESRYPDEKKEFYETCTEHFAQEKFQEMEDLQKWLIQKLEK